MITGSNIYGPYGLVPRRNSAANRSSAMKIAEGSANTLNTSYGINIHSDPTKDNWYDSISSLMQGSHKTSMSSLNDDNRQDEKEIELLEDASKITDDILNRYKDSEDFFTEKHLEALKNGDKHLAEYYRQ